jgi:hypothetical protein
MQKYDPIIESLALEVKTRQVVALEYGTTVKTLKRQLLKEGVVLPPGNIFPNTLKLIYYTLGIPAAIKAVLNTASISH